MLKHNNHIDLREEKEWIERSKIQPKAFEPLYTKYYDEIFRFIYRRTGREVLAAELCSETFYKALSRINTYTWQNILFGNWLYKIAANEIKKHYRNRKRIFIIEIDKIQEQIPIERIVDNTDPHHFFWVLEDLKEIELRLIELKYFENKTFKEIGLLLQMKESAVKMRLYRLLIRMRELINNNHDQV